MNVYLVAIMSRDFDVMQMNIQPNKISSEKNPN